MGNPDPPQDADINYSKREKVVTSAFFKVQSCDSYQLTSVGQQYEKSRKKKHELHMHPSKNVDQSGSGYFAAKATKGLTD